MAEKVESRFSSTLEWAFRGLVAALCAGALAVIGWGNDVNVRLHDLETQHVAMFAEIAALRAKEDGNEKTRSDIAVIRSQLDDQDRKLTRMESLLFRLQ